MSNLFKKAVGWTLGGLAGAGLFNFAYADDISIPTETPKFVQRLIQIGLIVPQAQRNVFTVNRRLLDQTIVDAEKGNAKERVIVERLRNLIGPEVDIRQVEIFEARVGTQDHM